MSELIADMAIFKRIQKEESSLYNTFARLDRLSV